MSETLSAMSPVLDPLRERIRDHWNRKSATFDEGETRVSRDPEVYQAWRRVFCGILGSAPKEILDVGAGTGELVFLLSGLGHRVRGIDLSPGMVAVATRKAREQGSDAAFEVADAERLPLCEASVDVIHARHLLWTLPHPRRALAEWLRVLRPGGIVLVTEATWDGRGESAGTRIRRRIGRLWARLRGEELPAPKCERTYPGPEALPFYGGLGRDGLRSFLLEAGLVDVKVVDLFWLRRMSRRALAWHRRWMNPGKTGYYAAWGRRP